MSSDRNATARSGVFGQRLLSAFAIAVLAAVLARILIPEVHSHRDGPRRPRCTNNLRHLSLALHNYHEFHGSFPPAYIADQQGRPMHSWRVLILPQLDQQALYDRYRFDEPWDGPNNSKLHDVELSSFRCPDEGTDRSKQTSYVAVIGPETAWPIGRGLKQKEITDSPAQTLLLAEVADSGIHWMEPRDLHVLQMAPTINAKAGQGIFGRHDGGANAAFADGSIRFLRNGLSPAMVRALLTIRGGEVISENDF